jgi:YD repeat-containing protein
MSDSAGDAPGSAEVHYTDPDGNPADETTATRLTVTSGGKVRAVLDYLDDDGNPTPQSTATRVSATTYDAAGNMMSVVVEPDDSVVGIDTGHVLYEIASLHEQRRRRLHEDAHAYRVMQTEALMREAGYVPDSQGQWHPADDDD